METLIQMLGHIQPPDENAKEAARLRWNSIAKPLGSLGLLESALIRIAGISRSANIDLHKRCVVVMCADNGVIEEGVTQSGNDVTTIVTENLTKAKTSVCVMSHATNCDVIPVDIGVKDDVSGNTLIVHKIARGTANMTKQPAMTREQAEDAILFGIQLVGKLKEKGYRLIATGEMGIGNTTTASAVTAVLSGRSPVEVTGRGAGLSSEGLKNKINAIERAIEKNKPDPHDALDVLSKVGGFDIAGIVGLFLGGAIYGVPIMIDGFISAAAALIAVRICPLAQHAMIASHCSKEPGGKLLLETLELEPLICAQLCLGEGTGAVAAMPILDMAYAVYHEMSTFSETNIEQYVPFE